MTLTRGAGTRVLIWSGAFIAIAIGIVVLYWNDGSRRGLGDRGRARAWSTAGSSTADETEVCRNKAREAVTAGRLDGAFELYRKLDQESWHADDCFALGSALLKRDRLVLGWLAFEAARRIDTKHTATSRARADLHTKLSSASGPEGIKYHEAATRVEHLRAIPDGPALGLLVLGLERFAANTDQIDEFLDRLNLRDQTALRGVNSIPAAVKLVARLLLETGRAPEAYELLGSLASNPAPGASKPDVEAAWLLSRTALQLDRHAAADAMLALAGDFGKRASLSPEPAPYVGSKRCAECHLQIYRDQQQDSRHAATLRFGADLKDVPLPAHPVPDPVVPAIEHRFVRKGDDRIELKSRAGDRAYRAVIDYALGSGRHGITMVARDTQGIDRELRVSYFAQNQGWGETKGISLPPRDEGEHLGVALTSESLHHCLNCHATWFRAVDQSRSGPTGPEREDRGIGCERCHGPGLNHVKAAVSGYAEMAIALTSKTPSAARLKSCVECHAADGSVDPSDPEFTRAQGTTFLFSRCFTANKDRFGCTTCHDPHRRVDTSIAHYEAKCLSCHQATLSRPAHQASSNVEHEQGGPMARSCPVNASGNCISCHMPKVEDTSRRARFTDHHIRVHREPAAGHASLPRP